MKRYIFLCAGALVFLCASFAFADLEQAEVSFLKGDYDLAIKNCDSAISSSKAADLPAAYYLKGRALLKQNNVIQSQGIFRKILSDYPDSRFCDKAQLGLAYAFFAEAYYDRAIGEYRKVQEKYPQSDLAAIALYKIARSCLKAGRMEEARSYLERLQQDYPLSFESKLMDELDNSEFAHTVQVGCFSKYDNAQNLADKLKKQGFDAYISEKDGYPAFYRVRVGKFKTESEANTCKASLQKKGYKTKICP